MSKKSQAHITAAHKAWRTMRRKYTKAQLHTRAVKAARKAWRNPKGKLYKKLHKAHKGGK